MSNVPETLKQKFQNDQDIVADVVKLANWIDEYHSERRSEFWNRLLNVIREELKGKPWSAELDPKPHEPSTGISLFPNQGSFGGEKKRLHHGRFTIRIELEAGHNLFYGICGGSDRNGRGFSDAEMDLFGQVGEKVEDIYELGNYWYTVWKSVDKPHRYIASKGRDKLNDLERVLNDRGEEIINALAKKLVGLVGAVGAEVTKMDAALRSHEC